MATKKKKKTANKKDTSVQNISDIRKSRTAAGKADTAKKSKKQPQEKKSFFEGKSQIVAIILFAFSIFSFCLTFIPGEKFWNVLHNFSLGMLGYCAYLFPIVLMYASIIIAMGRTKEVSRSGVVFSFCLVVFLASAFFIFGNDRDYLDESKFLAYITDSYEIGVSSVNGGVIGALFGGLLVVIFGKTGSAIIDIILIFVSLMLLTKTPLMNFLSTVIKPAQKAKKAVDRQKVRVEEKRREREEQETNFDDNDYFGMERDDGIFIDIPIGPSTKKKSKFTELEEAQTPLVVGDAEDENDTIRILELEDNYVPEVPQEEAKPRTRKKREKVEKTDSAPIKEFEAPETQQIPEAEHSYKKPPFTCLTAYSNTNAATMAENLEMTAKKLVETLRSYGVETSIIAISKGPSVTRYELKPAPGVRISRITNLANEIAMNLASSSGVRIEAPIPGKSAVGIEVPNTVKAMVSMREIVESPEYQKSKSKLNVALGKDIAGNINCADLAKMPHLLIAGTTGSGKSVCLNAMIVSLLYNATPDEVKLLMIDPKKVEFKVYNGIPHLLVPVVDDPRKAAGALAWAVTEMNNRYKLFSEMNVRDIYDYNKLAKSNPDIPKMHQIVIFIDELSDLMMAAPSEVEGSICRLAQMARAAGMHLVIATQRPSVDVITGLIKANVPSRISLMVSSQIDSRTIIDTAGAEKLLGNGDMLFAPVGKSKPTRIQGCYISTEEISDIVSFIKNQEETEYDDEIIKEIDRQAVVEKKGKGSSAMDDDSDGIDGDELLPQAIEIAFENNQISTSLLQRKLKVGYARAGRIVDIMEQMGIAGPYEGAKPRKVLITKQEWLQREALSESNSDYEDDSDEYEDYDE